MLKKLITYFIKKKNPRFEFDKELNGKAVFIIFYSKITSFLRSFKILIRFKVPRFLFLGKKVLFFNISNINFGKFVQLHDYVYLSAFGSGKLEIGNNVSIGAYSRLVISESFNKIGRFIRIGNNVSIGEYSYLGGGGGLEIGDDCIIGQYLSCHPENHNYGNLLELIK